MNSEAKKLGDNLKRIRTEKGISQAEIARLLDVSRGFVSSIESGKRNPTLTTITRLANAVGVTADELFK